jgi:ATP-dependent helicase Lhr and Lhr-like helicase
LRALLTPQEKRAPFGDVGRPRRHRAVTSIEFAGRWSLLRKFPAENLSKNGNADLHSKNRGDALEIFAKVLLRRYGVMFRKLLEREALKVSWFELGRIYRRLEARGEIRGGYFINGVSGEQFALPEAIGSLRSIRKIKATGELVILSAADPLNLVSILTPGARIASVWKNRILLRDGVPVAGLQAGKILNLNGAEDLNGYERSLKIGRMPAALRRYY